VPKQFATTVVLDENAEKVLLILRQDLHIWALPGGGLEPDETPEQAAVRETLEETGYEVAIDRFVGSYYRPRFCDTRYVYRARVTGGAPIQSGPETVEVGWFAVDSLPAKFSPFVPVIIRDVLTHQGEPFQKEQHVPLWQVLFMMFRIGWRDMKKRWWGH
jgi:8-oxo-dGTP pyrophosphatase MutT (NUDIX family)